MIGVIKDRIKAYTAYRMLNKIRSKYSDYLIIVATSGIGDICYALSYLQDLKLKEKKKVLAICSSYSMELLSFYPDIDEIHVLSKYDTDCFKTLGRSRLALTSYNNRNNRVSVYTCDAWRFLPWRVIRIPNVTFFDTIRYVNYELDKNSHIQYPVVPECDLSFLNIKDWNRVIIINPHSNYRNTESSIFVEIAQKLLVNNYDVYTNLSSVYATAIEGTKPLNCNLQQLYNIVKRAKCFISVRSGIVDFTVSSNGRFLVIYDYDKDEQFRKIYNLLDWKTDSIIKEIDNTQHIDILQFIAAI